MISFPPLPSQSPISDSLPQDESFFQHVERGWKTDLAHFLQYGVPKLVFALILAFIFQAR